MARKQPRDLMRKICSMKMKNGLFAVMLSLRMHCDD
jgi:hypothetical protein